MDLMQILTFLLSILVIVGSTYVAKYYMFSGKIKNILKETLDVIECVEKGLADGTFTKEEVQTLIKEIDELYNVVFPKGI